MKIISFKTLKVKNFLSIGPKLIEVHLERGINAIVGTNHDKEDSRNGAGKSSLLCALNFALYGETIRKVPKDNISNSVTKKGAYVELEFEVQTETNNATYRIVRTLKPSKCTIYKNGQDETLSTIAKCNEFLSALIRTPESVFQNSVILSLNHSLPFLALSKIDKRKYIESVMSLNAFTTMSQRVKEEYSQTKREYELRAKELNTLSESLKFNEAQEKEYKIKVNKQKQRIAEIEEELNSLVVPDVEENGSQETLKEKQNKLNIARKQLEGDLDLKKGEKAQITRDMREIEASIEELTHSVACPTCKREYDESTVQVIKEKIQEKQEALVVLPPHLEAVKKDIDELCSHIKQIEEKEEKIRALKEELQKEERERERVLLERKHLQSLLTELRESSQDWNFGALHAEIEQQRGKIKILGNEVDTLNKELLLLDAVKFIISEDGVKSFIIKKVLQLLNLRIRYYLQKLQANCVCSFNELFEDHIIDEHGESKSYFNFSGGERKRIDFACMFAFADIRRLQGDVVFETVFYDELLDTSLDDKGIELVLDVLQERLDQYKESCYIVTHRTADISTRADHVIKLEKRGGCTQLVGDNVS